MANLSGYNLVGFEKIALSRISSRKRKGFGLAMIGIEKRRNLEYGPSTSQ